MLIIGCGYTGRRLAVQLQKNGDTVTGTVMTPDSARLGQDLGITTVRVDLDNSPGEIPLTGHDRIFYLAPPPSSGQTDPRLAAVLARLRQSGQAPRIVYTSTTGVYGDCEGQWVTEDRPLNPATDRARRRAAAETQLLEWAEQSQAEVVILRVAGIYGPGRLPLERLRSGTPMISPSEAPFSNRIHVDDLVSVCLAAMDRGRSGQAYNVSDGSPGTMAEYFHTLARLAELPPPPTVSWAEAEKVMPPGLLSYLRENRRLDNTRMMTELGVQLRYPGLEAGLAASLD